MMDLGLHRQRVVDRPTPRTPSLLGDKQRGHEGFKHAPAPAGHKAHASIAVDALKDLDPIVGRECTPRQAGGRNDHQE